MKLTSCAAALALSLFVAFASSQAGSWPQFRGPNSAGRADAAKLPEDIGPESHVKWKVPLPPGHSSPAITEDRIFLTGVRDGKLLTMGLDRASGKFLWSRDTVPQNVVLGIDQKTGKKTINRDVIPQVGKTTMNCPADPGGLKALMRETVAAAKRRAEELAG